MREFNIRNISIKTMLPLVAILILTVALFRLKASQDRIYKPYKTIVFPKLSKSGYATAVAFSPDSKQMAIADTYGVLSIWKWENSQRVNTIQHHMGDEVQSLNWGKQTLVLSHGHSFKVFSLPQGKLIREAPANWRKQSDQYQRNHYSQTVISPDGTHVLFGQVHGAISYWNSKTGQPLWKLKVPKRETCGLVISPDNRYVAVASLLPVKDHPPRRLDFPNPELWAEDSEIEIAIRNARSGALLTNLHYEGSGIGSNSHYEPDGNLGDIPLAFSPDSKQIAAVI